MSVGLIANEYDESSDEVEVTEALEGRQLTRLHRIRERRVDLRDSKVRAVKKARGRLAVKDVDSIFKTAMATMRVTTLRFIT